MAEWLKKHWIWVAGGALLLLGLVWLRNRQASSGGSDTGGGQAFGPVGGGASAPVSDTTGQNQQAALDQLEIQQKQGQLSFSNAMNDLYLAGEKLRLQFGQQTLGSQADLINSQNKAYQGQLDLIGQGEQNLLQVAKTGHLPSGKGVIPMSCQHGDVVTDPYTGLPTCRTPEGGGFKPFQQIGQILSGLLQGAASAAPGIGASAARYYSGQYFAPGGPINPSQGYGQQPATVPDRVYTPGQMSGGFTPGISGNTVRIA